MAKTKLPKPTKEEQKHKTGIVKIKDRPSGVRQVPDFCIPKNQENPILVAVAIMYGLNLCDKPLVIIQHDVVINSGWHLFRDANGKYNTQYRWI